MPPRKLRDKFTESKLLQAWLKSGRAEDEFFKRQPSDLNDYEESKLRTAGVELTNTLPFFKRLKSLMGETEFAELCGEVAERQLAIEGDRGFPGLKPENPTAVVIGLGLHRLSKQAATAPLGLSFAPSPHSVTEPPPAVAQVVVAPRRAPAKREAQEAQPAIPVEGFEDVILADGKTLSYTARILVSCNLPHSNPGDVPYWHRVNGKYSLIITPGKHQKDGKVVTIGYPYGTMPRLITMFLATYAIINRSREISIGDSYNEFLRRLQVNKSAWTHNMVADQLFRLINANIRFSNNEAPRPGARGGDFMNANVADAAHLWWDERDPAQSALWQNKIVLNAEFYRELVEHGFPIDLDTVTYLRKSPLALDLYGWTAYRVGTLRNPLDLRNEELMGHLGCDYKNAKDFARDCRKAYAQIQHKWPGLKYQAFRGGFRLFPCAPPIPRKRPALPQGSKIVAIA